MTETRAQKVCLEEQVVAICDYTGYSIYEGEPYIVTKDGHILKFRMQILLDYYNLQIAHQFANHIQSGNEIKIRAEETWS